jgi:hypothetical protein
MTAPIYTDDTVYSCNSCPFSDMRFEGRGSNPFWCCHPKWDANGGESRKVSREEGPFDSIPSWCPLKEGPVLVQLRQRPQGEKEKEAS